MIIKKFNNIIESKTEILFKYIALVVGPAGAKKDAGPITSAWQKN